MAGKKKKSPALSFPVFFERMDDYSVEDDRFTKVKIYLMHIGLNLNNTDFEKDVVDLAIPTLQYIPIVGFISESQYTEKDFTGHKYVVVMTENGKERKYIGQGYGVISSNNDNNAHYEMRTCEDGIEREFLVVEGLLWNMFADSSEIMNRDLVKPHSMELQDSSVEGYEDEDGIFHFTKFSFRAACILGTNVQPAMTGSTIEVQYTVSDFVSNLQNELKDKYNTFVEATSKNRDGGNQKMGFTNYTQTMLNQFSDISNMVSQHEVIKNRWGEAVPRYYAVDIQENEIIVADRANNYRHYGLSFTMNGDKPEINYSTAKRKKIRYENYEEGSAALSGAFDFGKHIAEIENTAFEKITQAENKATIAESKASIAETDKKNAETNYTNLKVQYEDISQKYNEYMKAESVKQETELKEKKTNMFKKFEKDLSGNADFTAMKEKADELTLDEIENKCSVLYTRKKLEQDQTERNNYSYGSDVSLGIMDDESGSVNDYSMNIVHTKYGDIPVGK